MTDRRTPPRPDRWPARPDVAPVPSRSGRRSLWALAIGAWALYLVALLAEFGGGSIDPTDPANFNAFVLSNDLGRPIVVRSCKDARCASFYDDGDQVAMGRSVEELVSWGEPEPEWFLISDAAGHRVGCVTLAAPRKITILQAVLMSAAGRCRRGG